MKRGSFFKTFLQTDLFPNRETVGQENESVMIARFAGSVTGVGPSATTRTAERATEDRVKLPTPAPSLTWMDDEPQKVLRRTIDARRRK